MRGREGSHRPFPQKILEGVLPQAAQNGGEDFGGVIVMAGWGSPFVITLLSPLLVTPPCHPQAVTEWREGAASPWTPKNQAEMLPKLKAPLQRILTELGVSPQLDPSP